MKEKDLNEIRIILRRLLYQKLVKIHSYGNRCFVYTYKNIHGIYCSFADWGDEKPPILRIGLHYNQALNIINDPAIGIVYSTLPAEQLQLFDY